MALSAAELELPEVRRQAEEDAAAARREIGELKRKVMVLELSVAREKAAASDVELGLRQNAEHLDALSEQVSMLKGLTAESARPASARAGGARARA